MAELGFINRGIKNGSNLYVIRRSNARSMLIEVSLSTPNRTRIYIMKSAQTELPRQ